MIRRLLNATIGVKRRSVQILALLALHSSWGPDAKWFCNPVLTCHSCVLSWFACPIGVLSHFAGYRLLPLLLLGTIILLGVGLGRLLCGWICPFGLLQDVLHRIRTPKIRLPRWTNAVKYVVLLALVVAAPLALGEQTDYSFCRIICPASALQVTLPRWLAAGFTAISTPAAIKLGVLVVVLVLAVLSSRSFCRILCPIGALMAPFNLFSFWRVRPPVGGCRSCGICDRACPTDDRPSTRISRGGEPSRSLDCVGCGECGRACPHGAGRPAGGT